MNTNKSFAEYREIQDQRSSTEDRLNIWLRNNGWEHTSSTPGCYWMWRKNEFFCDTATAERIESHFTALEYGRLHPELFD
jgi:hypothetical protein